MSPSSGRSETGRNVTLTIITLVALALAVYIVFRAVTGWVGEVFHSATVKEEAPEETVEVVKPEPRTPPLPIDGFDASLIISDEQFFDTAAYDQAQVESFIAKWNDGCRTGSDGAPCLSEYREDTPSFEGDVYCPDGFTGETGDTAASVIWKSAQSCGINPQVLLTILQKEQGLITSSGAGLNETRYAIAMGYACPDASMCDPEYFGFAPQVYYAARQMRVYEFYPNDFMVGVQRGDYVPYAPNPDCGGTPLYVQNLATSNLYNYTPYQPDSAALAGDPGPCSSVGNLNFYAYFTAWFGTSEVARESAGG